MCNFRHIPLVMGQFWWQKLKISDRFGGKFYWMTNLMAPYNFDDQFHSLLFIILLFLITSNISGLSVLFGPNIIRLLENLLL